MGTKGRAIVNVNIEDLLKELNKALADEWLAYYQYWIGAKIVVGPMKQSAMDELIQHAADELRHAEMISGRILQLGGTPVLSPFDWEKLSTCGYLKPDDPYVRKVIDQGIKGEQCAIDVYSKLLEMVKDKDIVTYNLILSILQDEIEHEEDFQALIEDINQMMEREKK
ncbi:MAG TPA: ferritin [Firmicutes bacterium]|nr:ferritin [Bacillota bacterium]